MPSYFPEGNTSLPSDNELRSLQKIVGLGGLAVVGGAQQVFAGNYGGGTPTQTPTVVGSIATDLDAPNRMWVWTGTSWF
jgi:hypothetical protein